MSRYLTAVFLLAITCLFVLLIEEPMKTPAGEINLSGIPKRIGTWSLFRDIPVHDYVRNMLQTDAVLMREYVNPEGRKVYFSVIYCRENREGFHPPEICYVSDGFEVQEQEVEEVEITEERKIKVNKLLVISEDRSEIVLYWFNAGERVLTNYYAHQYYLLLNQLLHGKSSGTLIRVVSPVIEEDTSTVLERAKDFVREIVPVLPEYIGS